MKFFQILILVIACPSIFSQLPVSAMEPPHSPFKSHSIYQSKSVWETQTGEKITLAKLRGNPVVAAMIYTSCKASCPLIMADLKAIENDLSVEQKKRVQFAVFAFDSTRDQPEKLKVFAKKYRVDLAHWTFFHGSPSSIRELAALLGVRFKQLEGGDFDHSNIITILDSEGVIAHQQIGLRQKTKESINMLRKITASF